MKGQGEQFVMISPKDAAQHAAKENAVRVFDDQLLARVTDDVREGVIVATLG